MFVTVPEPMVGLITFAAAEGLLVRRPRRYPFA